jgi:hypothetical protein
VNINEITSDHFDEFLRGEVLKNLMISIIILEILSDIHRLCFQL